MAAPRKTDGTKKVQVTISLSEQVIESLGGLAECRKRLINNANRHFEKQNQK